MAKRGVMAFVDPGYARGSEFTQRFLQSAEFSSADLGRLSAKGTGTSKEERAFEIAQRADKPRVKGAILETLVSKPRRWAAIRLGRPVGPLPELGDPDELLEEFGKPGWYGPFKSGTGESWYIGTRRIPHYVVMGANGGATLDRRWIRWMVFVKITDYGFIAHWNNFSTNREDKVESLTQFAFWDHIDELLADLCDELGGDWADFPLAKLVLQKMWRRHRVEESTIEWQDIAVRAHASGVALNARSSGVKEIDVRGLKSLAEMLARTAASELEPLASESDIQATTAALMGAMIRDWGTKSYEFKLSIKKETLLKVHCYFGQGGDEGGQDSLVHLKSLVGLGGAMHAYEVLIDEAKIDGLL